MQINRPNLIAILIVFAAIFAVSWISKNIFENIPHVEDEFAYIWQARVFSRGQAYIPTPPHAKLFTVPFVIDYHGLRFSKYPPGWPLLLMIGMLLGIASWVNPLLAGLGVWLTYRLGQKIFNNSTALLAIGLMITSPFFLFNSAQFVTPPWSLVLSLSLTLAWFDLFFEDNKGLSNNVPAWIKVWVAGLSLGVLALTRPLSAIGVALPFFIHGLLLLWHKTNAIRRQILYIGLIATVVAALLPLWQYLLTGNPFQNLYELWWDYDRIGFGVKVGTQPGGYNNLFWVLNNIGLNLIDVSTELFGWRNLSWLFIPLGLWATRNNKLIEPVIGITVGLMLVYTTYWFGAARYYYEGILSCACLLSAAGLIWLAKINKAGIWRVGISLLTLLLIGYNLFIYLPLRFNSMKNLYQINRAQQLPFTTSDIQAQAPALVIIHTNKWTDCSGLLPLEDPWLTTPFIFACDLSTTEIIEKYEYPNRKILDYYPDTKELLLTPRR